MKYLVLILLAILSFWLYVRFAPSDPGRWNVDPETAEAPKQGSYRAEVVLDVPPETALEMFKAIVLGTPRTELLASSAAERRITFVTRSRVWGFPDYTTIAARPAEGGSRLTVLARLRFGTSDLGVNRARVEHWLQALQSGGR